MTFSCGNQFYPTIFSPVPIAPQYLLGSVMHVICQAKDPLLPSLEKFFLLTPQAIDEMMQAPTVENSTPFSYEEFVELY